MVIIPQKSWILSFLILYLSKLKIEGYSNCDPLANNIKDSALKSIVKYRNHPSIFATGKVYNKSRRLPFSFSKIQRDKILSDILNLETSKASQKTDIPKIVNESAADIFANVLVSNFNDSIDKSNFPSITIDQLAYSRIYLKSSRDAFFVNYLILRISFC